MNKDEEEEKEIWYFLTKRSYNFLIRESLGRLIALVVVPLVAILETTLYLIGLILYGFGWLLLKYVVMHSIVSYPFLWVISPDLAERFRLWYIMFFGRYVKYKDKWVLVDGFKTIVSVYFTLVVLGILFYFVTIWEIALRS